MTSSSIKTNVPAAKPPAPGWIKCCKIYAVDASKQLWFGSWKMALILEEMNNHGVALIVTSQGIDTSNTNPAGKLQLNVLMAVAEFERGIIRERVNAGLKAAKQRGVKLGRPRSLHKKTGAVLGERRNGLGVRAIARKLQMPPSSVHKILNTA